MRIEWSLLSFTFQGPLMALTFGSIINDKHLKKMGIINMIIGFTGTILFGKSTLNLIAFLSHDSQARRCETI